jgi:WD40 repeat protein
LELWDATSGQSIRATPLSSGDIFGIAYSPDGRRLAYCIGAWVKIQDAQTGEETIALGGHKEFVSCVAYSLDGQRIASGCFDQTVQIWDPNDGKRVVTLRGHLDRVMGVAFSPDGKRLASASADSTVKLWNLETGREVATLRGHSGYVWCVAFSPDGKRLASGGGHHQKGDIRLWDLSRVKPEASTETKTP